ncbi:hypothetical protein JCM11251_003516 [Rhodosporidiobolus azoricus]
MDWATYNNGVYEPFLAANYADDVRPWYAGKPSSVFAKFADGEFGRASVDQHLQMGRLWVEELRKMVEVLHMNGSDFWFKWEHMLRPQDREEVVLRTLKRPIDAAEKYNVAYTRDDCPELTVKRISTGSNFKTLCFGLLPPPGSSAPWCTIRSPGGVWERLQEPNTASGIGVTDGMRVWVEDGWARRHCALIVFCLGVLKTILGFSEEDLAVSGTLKVPKMDDSTRETYSTPIAGHQAYPPQHRPEAIRACTNCGNLEDGSKNECQVYNWKKEHKAICGRPLADTMQLGQRVEKAAIKPKDTLLDSLKNLPRTIMMLPGKEGSDNGQAAQPVYFELPNFVRPFRETLAALREARDKAFKDQDRAATGIVSIFMRLSLPSSALPSSAADVADSPPHRFLCKLLEVDDQALSGMEDEAERALQRRDEKLAVVASCFEQLKMGKPNPELPDLTIPDRALYIFDTLETNPKAWFAVYPLAALVSDTGASKPRAAIPVDLPGLFVAHDLTIAALRTLTYRVLEGRGQNHLDIAMLLTAWTLFNHTINSHKPADEKPPTPVENIDTCDEMFSVIFGLERVDLRRWRWEIMSELDESDHWRDPLYALILVMISQCEEQAAVPWPFELNPAMGGRKKRNKKKRKTNAKKGGNGVAAEAVDVLIDDEGGLSDQESHMRA